MTIDWNDKIRKLLAKAEDAATPQVERDNILANAHRLAEAQAIDIHRLGMTDPARMEEIISETWFGDGKRTALIKAKRELLFGLADLNRCRSVMHGRAYVVLVGHRSDVEFIGQMWNSIMLQLQTAMTRAESEEGVHPGQVKSWRVNYAHGYVRRVVDRMNEAAPKEEVPFAPRETISNALVLADRSERVSQHVAELYPKLGKANMGTSVRGWSDAYRRGSVDGNQADLGGTRVGNGGGSIGS